VTTEVHIPLNVETEQEVFDAVCRHFAQMTRQSIDGHGDACMYRTIDGNRCAVRALIADEHYDPRIENMLARHLADDGWGTDDGVRFFIDTDLDYTFIGELQSVHDNGGNWTDNFDEDRTQTFNNYGWSTLRSIAERRDLSVVVLDEVAGSLA
jgi:hypothetical protein